MTVLFILTILPLCYLVKLFTFRGASKSPDWAIILVPFRFAAASKRMLPLSAAPALIRRFVVFLGVCICAYWLYWQLLRNVQPPLILLSYLGALILWPVGEALGSLIPFLTMPSGRLLPLPHGATPPLAKSLSEFWGRRWNVWVSDLFRQTIFRPLQSRPMFALVLVFLISGLLHELAINVPLYIVTGRKLFGTMILYFLLQAIGILIERKMHNRTARIFLVWLFVFGTVPLMVNEGMLRILHLWPE